MTKRQREKLKGKYGGRCAYCGCVLGDKWHVDHVISVQRDSRYCKEKHRYVSTGKLWKPENNCLENMMPACVPCNIDKGPYPLEDWRMWLQDRLIEYLRSRVGNFRHAERFGLITVAPPAPLVFWFEKYKAENEHAA